MKADSELHTEERTCHSHGPYTARVFMALGRRIVGQCPKCLAESIDAEARRAKRIDAMMKARQLEALFDRAGIPPRFKACSFGNFDTPKPEQEKALRAARDYADNWPSRLASGTCLIFSGSPGTGKTHLSCAIANQVLMLGSPVLFTTVSDAIRSIKRAYDKDAGISEAEAINMLAQPHLLILDEVGMAYDTEHSKALFFDLMNKRYELMRPTILLTNLDAEALRAHLGDRITDRLRDGGGRMIPFNWESHRE